MKFPYHIHYWLLFLFVVGFVGLRAQNHLDNPGFESYKTDISLDNAPLCNPASDNPSCIPVYPSPTYYSSCPGGYAKVQRGLQVWTDRSTVEFTSGCAKFCAIHCPDWIFNNIPALYNGYQGPFATFPLSCPFGNSCVAAGSAELFQQKMNKVINRAANYMISAVVKTNPSSQWLTDESSIQIQFILDHNQTKYTDETCDDYDNQTSNFDVVENKHKVAIYTVQKTDAPLDWQPIEISLPVLTSDGPNYEWFSINLDGSPFAPAGPYFGFDEIYIDEAGCFCPIERNIQDLLVSGNTKIRAQEFLIIGTSVEVLNTPNTNVLFTAGNSITINPGFQTDPGATVEIKIANCYDSEGAIELFLPNAYTPNCDGVNDLYCFETKNVSSYSFLYCLRDGTCTTLQGSINTDEVDAGGYNTTCLNFPVINGTTVYTYVLDAYGCNGAYRESHGSITALDVVEGCGASWKKAPTSYLDSVSSKDGAVRIFPSPFCDFVDMESPNFDPNDIVTIVDASGNCVKTIKIEGIKTQIPFDKFADGIYFVHYSGANCYLTDKIVKTCEH